MEEEFTLSEKIQWLVHRASGDAVEAIFREDVFEFIKKINQIQISVTFSHDDVSEKEIDMAVALFKDWKYAFFETIDKLAGDKLR